MALLLSTTIRSMGDTAAKTARFARKADRLTAVLQGSSEMARWAVAAAIAGQLERDLRRATYAEMNTRMQEPAAKETAWLVGEPGTSVSDWVARNATAGWLRSIQWLLFSDADAKAMDRLDAAARTGGGLPFPFAKLEQVAGITIEGGLPERREGAVLPASNFLVTIDGIAYGFSSVSSFDTPAPGKPGALRLKRAVSGDRSLSDWYSMDTARLGVPRVVEIVLLDGPGGNEAARWVLTGCTAVKWEGPELDALQNGLATESVEVSYRSLFRI